MNNKINRNKQCNHCGNYFVTTNYKMNTCSKHCQDRVESHLHFKYYEIDLPSLDGDIFDSDSFQWNDYPNPKNHHKIGDGYQVEEINLSKLMYKH